MRYRPFNLWLPDDPRAEDEWEAEKERRREAREEEKLMEEECPLKEDR